MRQLTGLDNIFFDLEAAGSPMILSMLDIYDVSTAKRKKTGFRDVLKVFESRFDRLTMLSQKLKRVPLGLDYPYWVDDRNFDLRNHFHKRTLPAPGGWEQLMRMVSGLQNKPFDEDKPLWEAYVIEGLDKFDGLAKGSFALFIRMHHSFADGAVTMALRQTIHDESRVAKKFRAKGADACEESHGSFNLLAKAYRNTLQNSIKTAKLALKTLAPARQLFARGEDGELASSLRALAAGNPPGSLLNPKSMSKDRYLGMRRFEYAKVKSIRKLVDGATINDVAAAIMAGALRRYLTKRGEELQPGMTSMMSVNLRREGDKEGSNLVSQMTIPVFVDIEDPVERLRLIRGASKKMKRKEIMDLQRNMAEIMMAAPAFVFSPAMRMAAGLMGKVGLAQASTALSNVPSFLDTRYLAGAKLTYLMGYGMLMPGVGLGNSVTIYDGWMMYGVVTCPEVMDDLDEYMTCVEESFQEYSESAK